MDEKKDESQEAEMQALIDQVLEQVIADINKEWLIDDMRMLYIQKMKRLNIDAVTKYIDDVVLDENGDIKSEFKNESTLPKAEILKGVHPEKYVMPNNKLINTMTKENVPYDGSAFDLRVHEGKEETLRQVRINYEDDAIQIHEKDKRFTAYDRVVLGAICTLYDEMKYAFTPEEVYRTMNGLHEGESVSPQSIGSVTRSIDKMKKMEVTVDYSQEFKRQIENRGTSDGNGEFYVDSTVLHVDKIRGYSGGHYVTAYRVLAKPIIYEYAQATGKAGHVITIQSKLLNTKEIINNTREITVIKIYLLRRIEMMKNKKNKVYSNNILFESIFKEIEVPEPSSDKSRKVRNAVDKLLSFYKREKHIKNFEFYKSGRSFKGVRIFL